MDNPQPLYQKHLNSIYVYQTGAVTSAVEIGWYWLKSVGKPVFFRTYVKDGLPYNTDLYDAPKGTNHNYRIELDSASLIWKFKIDGNNVNADIWISGFYQGNAIASSEKDIYDENNYGHFWDLERKLSGNWSYWTNMQQWVDSDNYYWWERVNQHEVYMKHI